MKLMNMKLMSCIIGFIKSYIKIFRVNVTAWPYLVSLLFFSTLNYLWRLLRGKKPSLAGLMMHHSRRKIFCIGLGKHEIFLRFSDMLQGIHDPDRESHIPYEKMIRPGDVVCDVGAHIGTHTLLMAQLVKGGKVISVEPEIGNFAMLLLNIKHNMMQDCVQPILAGLASRCGKRKLYHSSGGRTMYYSISDARKADVYDEVRVLDFCDTF